MKIKLHHFAYNIRPETLELVIEFFKELNCSVSYREKEARWCLFAQKSLAVDIQIIERDYKPIEQSKKVNTHIAFISDNPSELVDILTIWAEKNKVNFRKGAWSDKEFWFDLSDVFINFVIEIMHDSVSSD